MLLSALTIVVFVQCEDTDRRVQILRRHLKETGAGMSPATTEYHDGFSAAYEFWLEDSSAGRVDYESIANAVNEAFEDSSFSVDRIRRLVSFSWNIDGEVVGDKPELVHVFAEAREHEVIPVIRVDGDEVYRSSRTLTPVTVGEFKPGETIYFALPGKGANVVLPGRITGISGNGKVDDSVFTPVARSGDYTVFRAHGAGYYSVTSRIGDREYTNSVFVSPVPTYHVDRVDRNWYYTQFRTRTTSNCGPSVVAMGIAWARGHHVPVETVRSIIGWQNTGAVSLYQMRSVLDDYGVDNSILHLDSPEVIFEALDRGHLVGVVYDMARMTVTQNPEHSLFGQYYADSGGHYLMIKGYSLDRSHFVVYDPIPSDWHSNSGRYGDGMSMYGRNRYYSVEELFHALRSYQGLEIKK